jgi:hypothetical protein
MDFLESLNVPALPEQQTRISDKVSSKLESNPNIRLGFDACCNCANKLELSSKTDVCCKGCRRVWYCSKECRREDAQYLSKANEEEQAHGHTSVICALLRLCQIEDDLEDPPSSSSSSKKRHFVPTKAEIEAAHDRIRSEYESYPATLANVLMDAPCFQPLLETYSKSFKRSKTMRQADLESKTSLTVHIIGASLEAELWGSFNTKKHSSCDDVYDAYAEALHELVSDSKGLRTINLIFVGPNCPNKNQHIVRVIDPQHESFDEKNNSKKRMRCSDQWHHKRHSVELVIETYKSNYDVDFLKCGKSKGEKKKKDKLKKEFTSPRKPDVVVFFNPGFTCPDYTWDSALRACQTLTSTEGSSIPFFVTTNTEMEAVSDLQFLYQHSFIDSIPLAVADIVSEGIQDHDTDAVDYDAEKMMFFGENPSAGTRVRQSGNMANDLFVKNRLIFGGTFSGLFDKKDITDKNGSARISPLNPKKAKQELTNKSTGENSTVRRILESNSKKKNFALM